MRTGVFLIFLICAFGSEWVRADFLPTRTISQPLLMLAANGSERAKPKISKQKAASRAKRAYPNNKVLSIKLIGRTGPAVYRLKMLSSEGVVKYVFVDGQSGSVFE